MSVLFIMVGCPGSGKSYFLKNSGTVKNSSIVSRDDIRFSLLEDTDKYFDKEKQVFKTFVKTIQKELDSGKNVYADATHINGVSRFKLINSLNLEGVDIVPIVMNTPLDVCLQRNKIRTGRKKVPVKVIEDSYKNFTDPTNDEVGLGKNLYLDILHIDYKR